MQRGKNKKGNPNLAVFQRFKKKEKKEEEALLNRGKET